MERTEQDFKGILDVKDQLENLGEFSIKFDLKKGKWGYERLDGEMRDFRENEFGVEENIERIFQESEQEIGVGNQNWYMGDDLEKIDKLFEDSPKEVNSKNFECDYEARTHFLSQGKSVEDLLFPSGSFAYQKNFALQSQENLQIPAQRYNYSENWADNNSRSQKSLKTIHNDPIPFTYTQVQDPAVRATISSRSPSEELVPNSRQNAQNYQTSESSKKVKDIRTKRHRRLIDPDLDPFNASVPDEPTCIPYMIPQMTPHHKRYLDLRPPRGYRTRW
ncbi:unnamed protein product [Moneuplotes crassus]|uniref:Uncharacterized protein n=1 Tax=Euplotes crassus TaxID=5936 RepID=A0AAD1XGR3_EUPCR|nr:unnamed protein product [Moneuplotes crassus]